MPDLDPQRQEWALERAQEKEAEADRLLSQADALIATAASIRSRWGLPTREAEQAYVSHEMDKCYGTTPRSDET